MNQRVFITAVLTAATIAALAVVSQPPSVRPGGAFYVPHVEDPVLKALKNADKKRAEDKDAATRKIVDAQKALRKKDKEEKKDLRINMKGLKKPSSPGSFKVQAWHFSPVPQYLTGTCWAFSTNSFFESEIYRLTGRRIKLSEMWTVYHEYLEKAKHYINTRGNSPFDEGSESEALPILWKKYGIVPESAYRGIATPGGRFDHEPMVREMKAYLTYCKANNYWNKDQILAALKLILNKTMGAPPEMVTYQGENYTPLRFLHEVTKLRMDDYVSFMSTESVPFWTTGEYKVPDNWRHDKNYYNLPLKEWYGALLKAVKDGSSAALGGDVSEPGYDGYQKVAIIPAFDIPATAINQDARELRIYNDTTTDDHGIHLVGWQRIGDHDWFLIKDSARASRKAKPNGYFYYRGDYVKLKMLTYMVNKSFVKDILARFHDASGPNPATVDADSRGKLNTSDVR